MNCRASEGIRFVSGDMEPARFSYSSFPDHAPDPWTSRRFSRSNFDTKLVASFSGQQRGSDFEPMPRVACTATASFAIPRVSDNTVQR